MLYVDDLQNFAVFSDDFTDTVVSVDVETGTAFVWYTSFLKSFQHVNVRNVFREKRCLHGLID